MKGVKWMQVELSDHDPAWEQEYARSREHILSALGSQVLDIQHVGSTSIRGIAAKPILDIAVRVRDLSRIDTPAMERIGYWFKGAGRNQANRILFIRFAEDDVAIEHVHCYADGDPNFTIQVGFRDYLNTHPEEAAAYDRLKRDLAARHPDDRFAYSEGKEAFIEGIVTAVRRELGME